MTYRVPHHRHAAIQEVLGALADARRVVLTTHLNADGDGAGSEIALAAFLRQRGVETWIVNPTPFPRLFNFLLPDPSWVSPASDPETRDRCRKADLAVVLDTGEVPRIGRVRPMIAGLPTVVVDHHPPGERPIEGLGLRDAAACATGELVYDLLITDGGAWPPGAAEGLYVAILTDTGSFRHSNTTPQAHRIVADLIERGGDPAELYRKVYGAYPARRLGLLAASLATLGVDENGLLAWMTVPDEAFRTLGCEPDDLEGLVDYPRGIAGVEVAALFRQIKAGMTKISFRSNGSVDVNAVARTFDGGGHVKAAGAVVKGPVAEVRERALDAVRAALEDTPTTPTEGGGQEPSTRE
jgi:phosphoesterase RecJ-like protein